MNKTSKNNNNNTPKLDRTTLEYIDNLYPERAARRGQTNEEIWIQAGQRELINAMFRQLKWQEDSE